jgi:hypothetical protein
MTKTQSATRPNLAAALEAATQAHKAAGEAITAAQADVKAAEEALAAAKTQAIEAVKAKIGDPDAAREHILKARAATEKAEKDLDWCLIQLQASEVVQQACYEEEIAARRALIADEYAVAHAAWHDPQNREGVLRKQIEDALAELVMISSDRRRSHERLQQEVGYFSEEERLKLPGGGLSSSRPSWYAPMTITLTDAEIKETIEAGIAAGKAALDERERAARA